MVNDGKDDFDVYQFNETSKLEKSQINKKRILFVILVIVCVVCVILIWNNINKTVQSYGVYKQYENQIKTLNEQEAEKKQQEEAKKEQERQAKLPKLTSVGEENMSNIYKSDTKRAFLTFDDGPSSVTNKILDTLKQENIKATFFVLGSNVEEKPELVKRMYEEGHFVANHGYSHVYSQIYASPQSVIDEYNKSVTAIRNAIGEQEYNPHLFRFPGGYWGGKYAEVKKQAKQLLDQNDILHIDWNALTSDAAGAKTTEQFIAELDKTVPKHKSVVVLMHDAGNKKATAEALPTIIKYFRDKGFEFENFYSIIK